MHRIVPSQSAAQAKGYYTHSDYLTEDQERPGVWRGKLAERLGLSGLVENNEFEALCEHRHQQTGERLTPTHPLEPDRGVRLQLPCSQVGDPVAGPVRR